MARYPNARDNSEEKRLMRAGLYQPLMKLPAAERARVVDLAVKLLVPEDA
jgi:type I restriction enzyme R subunit